MNKTSLEMSESTLNILFPISWVARELKISQYSAKKMIIELVGMGIVYRVGNRYRYNAVNNLSVLMGNMRDSIVLK